MGLASLWDSRKEEIEMIIIVINYSYIYLLMQFSGNKKKIRINDESNFVWIQT